MIKKKHKKQNIIMPLIYKASIGQISDNAPIENVFENTIDSTAQWARDGLGFYSATTNVPYVSGKVFMSGFGDFASSNPFIPVSSGARLLGYYTAFYGSNGGNLFWQITTVNDSFDPMEFSELFGDTKLSFPTIEVYP